MRTVGTFLSLFCALIAIGLLFLGYVGVFEGNQVIPESESPLPEGSDYWIRKEFWHDIRLYALWVMWALGSALIPIFGVVRSGFPLSTRKGTDWILSGISVMYLVLWSWWLERALHGSILNWILIPILIMFSGSLYGLGVFWRRARYKITEEAQSGPRD